MGLRHVRHLLRALMGPGRAERDLHDELSFHIERETRKLIDQGMAPDEARARSRARFGSATLIADECRDQRGTAFVDNTIRDVRFALRSFRRAPLAAFTIVATVAVGLGVVAVLFTILNTFLFRTDTVPAVGEMYAVDRLRGATGERSPFTRPQFDALRSDKGWDRHFNRDPDVLGRTVLVGGAPFEIIGVMPAGFRGLEFKAPDAWAPLAQLGHFRPGDRGRENAVGVEIVGRLKPGVSSESARAQLQAW